ncbi:MAG: hypothetical protein H7330_08125 [Hymenobacteraceae bacterium]|nr:hypothetical protein [Hymenobacteraceae bacterium]
MARPSSSAPVGRFRSPTARLGEAVVFELMWRHPADEPVILPDSASADFRPFELVRRRVYPTRTTAGSSLDRVAYWIRTFAPDSIQTLVLGGRHLTPRGDTVLVPGTGAALRVRFVTPAPDPTRPPTLTPVLRAETVPPRVNWPWWAAGAGALMLAGLAAWLIWGRRARARYRAYRRRKNHQYFLAQYTRHIERFELSRSVSNLERAITLWKNYLTTLENQPINSLTTKELLTIYQHDEAVADALRLGDRAIYGNQLSDDIARETRALAALRTFANARYEAVGEAS